MSGYDLSHLSVLVVDDNKHMLTLLRTILHGLGVGHIREALDAGEALREMRSFAPDILITDWVMSPMDGLELVRRIRCGEDSPNPYMPIIMLTGYTELHRVVESRDAGVTEFLAKPVSAKALYSRIIGIIERPRPFVRTKSYFGPDRRRREDGGFQGPERRGTGCGSDDGLEARDAEAGEGPVAAEAEKEDAPAATAEAGSG